ncbi:MAG: hypothetical protein ACREMH_11740 [Gemmatimonadales bacterium]
MRRAALFLVACLPLAGCVYFNGVYNARRLTRQAEQAEKDGRQFEAQSLYGQVAAKAESVLVRHPRSRYVDDARYLRGNALARTRNCAGARPDLEAVTLGSGDASLVEKSLSVLADCYLELGEWAHASEVLTRLRSSANPGVRRAASTRLVRSLRAQERYAEALAVIEESPDVGGMEVDRAIVLAAIGQDSMASRLADSLLAAPGARAVPWDTLVAALAQTDPVGASALVDRVTVSDSVPVATRSALLVADARRWATADSARALARLGQAIALEGEGAGPARLALVSIELAGAPGLEALRPLSDTLQSIERIGGTSGITAAQRRAALDRVLRVADSVRPDTAAIPEGDLWLFHLAESLRDSVGASRAAVSLFALVPEEYPDSPFAPKAMLARAALEPVAAESLAAAVSERYPSSPYLAVLRGEEAGDGYVALEDSLRRWAGVQRLRAGRQPARPPPPPAEEEGIR